MLSEDCAKNCFKNEWTNYVPKWEIYEKRTRLIIIIFSYFTGAPGAGGAKSGAGPTIEEVD